MDYTQMLYWFWDNYTNMTALKNAAANPNWDWLRVDIEQLIDAQGDEECEMEAMGNIDSSIVERAEWVRSL